MKIARTLTAAALLIVPISVAAQPDTASAVGCPKTNPHHPRGGNSNPGSERFNFRYTYGGNVYSWGPDEYHNDTSQVYQPGGATFFYYEPSADGRTQIFNCPIPKATGWYYVGNFPDYGTWVKLS